MMNNKAGFTLMEMLIVVAIISVLVAISVTVLSDQIEISREASDLADIRSSYEQVMAAVLADKGGDDSTTTGEDRFTTVIKYADAEGNERYKINVHTKQVKTGWQSGTREIYGVTIPEFDSKYKNNSPYFLIDYNVTQDILQIVFKHS